MSSTSDAPQLDPAARAALSTIGRIGAHAKWANCEDRTAATAPARAGLEEKFLDEAGGDPKRAESLRKAYYTRLALKSAQARRARRLAFDTPAQARTTRTRHGGESR